MDDKREHGVGRERTVRTPWRRLTRWQQAALASAVGTGALALALALVWGPPPTFAVTVGVALAGHVGLFAVVDRRQARTETGEGKRGERSHRDGVAQQSGRDNISPATALTAVRGSAAVVLAGVLVAPPPSESLVWLPALLFGVAAGLDALDGTLARATDTTSAFGGRLDVETDAFAVLVAVLVAVRLGQAPAVFLALGLARYAFLAGLTARRLRGLAVRELPPRFSRRLLGALQVTGIVLVLSPALGATPSRALALAVMVPVLAGFLRDWRLVTRG